MGLPRISLILLVIILTLLSGWGDSRGFIHASRVWKDGELVLGELGRSALGFGLGILMYWIVIRFLRQFGIISAELQTIGWFGVTIIGVALSSGEFSNWQTVDKVVSISVLFGIGWLLLRVS